MTPTIAIAAMMPIYMGMKYWSAKVAGACVWFGSNCRARNEEKYWDTTLEMFLISRENVERVVGII